jgi:phage/plasmid-like protein (TIGR03299 family)
MFSTCYYRLLQPLLRTCFPKDKVAIVRKDNGDYLGTVGDTYEILQYDKTLEFTELLVSEHGANYVSGGAIGKGEQAFIVMKTPEFIALSDKDKIECYFYIATSHDGTIALSVVPTPYRKINKTVLIHQSFKPIMIKHTRYADERITKATRALARVKKYWAEFKTSFEMLAKTPVTIPQARVYFKEVIWGKKGEPTKQAQNIIDTIEMLYKFSQPCQLPNTKGTILGAYFATVQYHDQNSMVKKSKKRDEESSRILSVLAGGIAQKKANALGFALKLQSRLSGVEGAIG